MYAGSFDPPGLHHRLTAERLADRFDEVIVLPAGTRPGDPRDDSLPIHRAVMTDLNFRRLDRVRVELGDLETGKFTPHAAFPERFGDGHSLLSHVVPTDVVRGGGRLASRVHREWEAGPRVWAEAHFTILHEPREPIDAADLPPHHQLLEVPTYHSSALIRTYLFEPDGPTDELLTPAVASYIRRHGLFRPTPPARECIYRVPAPKIRLFFDRNNTKATAAAEMLRKFEAPDPELIVSVGGDGTMLRAIRKHWRERLPFYGVNTGHLGFLLNDRDGTRFWEQDLRLYQLPLLWVETESPDGHRRGELAFNDCWIERETGQTAWIEVSVNGRTRMPKVVADGMLVATAAGSTSYARAMRATPLPFN
ncbi:MAG: NAD(+)/NADH kinase, partial [Fimbriiglobus sp.]